MKIVSLFSGAGGLDLGLINAGHEIIWANDIDIDSCETYRLNIGNHIVCKDISMIDLNEIPNGQRRPKEFCRWREEFRKKHRNPDPRTRVQRLML